MTEYKKDLTANLTFEGKLAGTHTLREITRYSFPWLVATAVLALIGILTSPLMPYWGSVILGVVVAIATFVTGGLAAVRVVRQVENTCPSAAPGALEHLEFVGWQAFPGYYPLFAQLLARDIHRYSPNILGSKRWKAT